MGLFSKWFGKPDPAPARSAASEHAVIVYLRLSDNGFGTEAERDAIHALTDRLAAAISAQHAGEFDGDEFGAGACGLYMSGPNADRLFAAVEPLLRADRLAAGGYAIKRYGPASDPNALVARVDFPAG